MTLVAPLPDVPHLRLRVHFEAKVDSYRFDPNTILLTRVWMGALIATTRLKLTLP
jgi:hypothetical protein